MHHSACFSFPFTWRLTNAVPSAHFTYCYGVAVTQFYADLIFVFTGKSAELDNKHTQVQFDPCVWLNSYSGRAGPQGRRARERRAHRTATLCGGRPQTSRCTPPLHARGCSSTSSRSSRRTVRSLYSFILVLLRSSIALEYFPEQSSTWTTCKNPSFVSRKKGKSPKQCNLAPSISQKDLLLERMTEALTGMALLGWKSLWDPEQQLTWRSGNQAV